MSKKKLFNPGPNDPHIQKWKGFNHPNGESFDLSHLNAHAVTYPSGHTVYVTYSHHCFCKEEPALNDCGEWQYYHPKDPRPFHIHRYELSKGLRKIIEELHSAYIGHAGHSDYATIPIGQVNGRETYYKVTFAVFRSEKKLRLHVTSAYPIEIREKLKKIRLENILAKVLRSRSQK
ncbi:MULTISPECIES: stationary phase growth adaptation protein [unclassified Oceanobacter]|uniref:stationary phase growth adaptation protein n=1 Tax=unclassified Oceanobacter TaxID=2620260 RepID=UPI002733C9A2|nr:MULTISPECIES: stationary phase growth adaptation protein [unclassified Oceanobacter]MDP2608123.1 stationary phase growth adaptation protein [Oceanobacter sp. 1_MG-2023]MDP2611215.1 stationary phase growth adaptation protein [Oceanobacter sp. 2_MG-2023]